MSIKLLSPYGREHHEVSVCAMLIVRPKRIEKDARVERAVLASVCVPFELFRGSVFRLGTFNRLVFVVLDTLFSET